MSYSWRVGALTAIVFAAVLSSGCIPPAMSIDGQRFGNLPGLDPEQVLQGSSVSDGLMRCRIAAMAIAGTVLFVLTIATAGGIWFGWFPSLLKATSGWLLWSGLAFVTIACFGERYWCSPDLVIRTVGSYLGDNLKPERDVTGPYVEGVAGTARASLRLRQLLAGGDFDWKERAGTMFAVAFLTSTSIGSGFMYLNSIAVLTMKMLLQASYAFLIAFYTMIGPLVAVALIVAPWRKVFWAYLRLYLSIALWPAAWGLAERALDGIMEGWFRTVHQAYLSGDPYAVAQGIGVGAFMTFIANVLFFFVYLGVPIFTTLLISASGKAFRYR